MTVTTTIDWSVQQVASLQRSIAGGGKPGLARMEQLAGNGLAESCKEGYGRCSNLFRLPNRLGFVRRCAGLPDPTMVSCP